MQQNDNVIAWADFWARSTFNPMKLGNEDQMAEKWNRRSENFGKTMGTDARRKRTERVLGFLKDGGFFANGAKVLDIGCGTGSLSLPLARMGAVVTALDISSGMLKKVEKTAKEENLNIQIIEGSWWSTDIATLGLAGQFDLVIAARTPAIRDAQCLDRMKACSRNYCLYIGFIKKNGNNVRRDISRLIFKKNDYTGNTTSMFFPFMYLYLAGYQPQVCVNFRKKKEECPWEQAAENAIEFFSCEREFDEQTKKQIRDYFKSSAIDGIHTSQNDTGEGMLLWQSGTRP